MTLRLRMAAQTIRVVATVVAFFVEISRRGLAMAGDPPRECDDETNDASDDSDVDRWMKRRRFPRPCAVHCVDVFI